PAATTTIAASSSAPATALVFHAYFSHRKIALVDVIGHQVHGKPPIAVKKIHKAPRIIPVRTTKCTRHPSEIPVPAIRFGNDIDHLPPVAVVKSRKTGLFALLIYELYL